MKNSKLVKRSDSPPTKGNIMGTTSPHVGAYILSQTLDALQQPHNKSADKVELSAQVFQELQPQNALEAMLISQMVACHSHCMKMFANAGKTHSEDSQAKYLRLSERLMRCFTQAMEALEKCRRKGQQSVLVEHVHVNAGGQAIVGNVNQNQ